MKTLKRTLCLVLVLALSVSLFAVAASAASYDDYADADATTASKYAEAIDVCIGLGIINGVDGNKVAPEATLSRAMAAKILGYLLLGEKTAEGLAASDTEFSDVAVDNWASKYIAYAANKEILTGSNGLFRPDDPVEGYSLGKMILNALGYGIHLEDRVSDEGKYVSVLVNDYTGTYWATKVSVDGNEIGLFAGLEDVDLNKPLNRGQAMQMVFNALKFDGSRDDNELGGITGYINEKLAYAIAKTTTDATDVCGRAGYKWVIDTDNDEDGSDEDATKAFSDVYNEAPDYSFTATADAYSSGYPADNLAAINKALGLKDDAALALAGTYSVVTNAGTPGAAFDASNTIKKGDAVEVYLDDDGKIEKVIIIRYDLFKVTKIDTETVTDADKKAGVTSYITINDGGDNKIVKSNKFEGFAYAKDAYILAALKSNDVIASKAATIVSGEVTATKGNKALINGTYYDYDSNGDGTGEAITGVLAIGEEYTYAMNQYGMLEAVITAPATTSSNYAHIYAIEKKEASGSINAEGVYVEGAVSYVAYAVLSDGTKASYTLATEKADLVEAANEASADDNKFSTILKGTSDSPVIFATEEKGKTVTYDYDLADSKLEKTALAYAYVINTKGALEVTSAPTGVTIGSAVATEKINKDSTTADSKYLTNNTVFIFVSDGANKTMTVTKTVGYKNVDIEAADNGEKMIVISNNKSEATIIYVLEAVKAPTVQGTLAVLLDETPVITKNGNNSYYTYDVSIDGANTTITSKGAIEAIGDTVNAGDMFSYTVTDEKIAATVKANFDGSTETVVYVGTDYIATDKPTKIDLEGVTIYTVTQDNTASGKITAVKGGTLSAESGKESKIIGVSTDSDDDTYEILVITIVKNPA